MKPTERRPSRAGGRPRGAGARRPPTDRVTTPAQPSRRAAANVYSDESGEDAPEDKPGASRRFDETEDFGYRMPANFEDEEIEEEEAFNSEDEALYGDWFAGRDRKGDAGGEVDWDDEDDEEGASDGGADALMDSEEEERPSRSARGRTAGGAASPSASDGDDDDGDSDDASEDSQDAADRDLLGDSDEDADLAAPPESDQEDGGGQTGLDPEAAASMLDAALGRRPRRAVGTLAAPEGSLTVPGTGLSTADLIAGLGDARSKLGPARRALTRLGTGAAAPASAPAPRALRERADRKAGYAAAARDVSKWTPIIKAHREAPTLILSTGRELGRAHGTTAALAAAFKPGAGGAAGAGTATMESDVAALLAAAKADSVAAVAGAEAAAAAAARLDPAEAAARTGELAKMRALLFAQEAKLKRLKKIKSKDYRRRLARAARAAAARGEGFLGLDEEDGGVEARAAAAAAREAARAEERVSLKHRHTGKWARHALRRGALADEGTREALAEQLRLGQELRRKVDRVGGGGGGGGGSDGGGGESTDASDDDTGADADADADPAARSAARLRAAAQDILGAAAAGDAPVPAGLAGLPFMRRAATRRAAAAAEEAQATLADLDGEAAASDGSGGGDGGGGDARGASPPRATGGRLRIGGGGGATPRGGAAPAITQAGGGSSSDDDDGGGRAPPPLPPRPPSATAAPPRTPAAFGSSGFGEDVDAAAGLPPTTKSACPAPTALDDAATAAQRAALFAPPAPGGGGSGSGVPTPTAPAARGRTAPPTPAGASAPPVPPPFIPARAFTAARPGYAFKKGAQGLGFYADKSGGAPGTATTPPAAGASASPATPARGRAGAGAAAGAAPAPSASARAVRRAAAEAAGEEADLLTPLPDARAGLTQADLVAAAFAGDDVGADFAAAKAAEAGAELPDPDAAVAAAGLDMPGWGAWAASSAPRRAAAAAAVRSAAERDRAAAASRRRDARLPGVILSERWDKKAAKYATPAVPHPFPDAAAYEASMRAPLGRDFNTDASFRDAVRPALITAPGAIIKPARFSAAAARAAGEAAALSNGARKRTAVVAGGMPKRTRR